RRGCSNDCFLRANPLPTLKSSVSFGYDGEAQIPVGVSSSTRWRCRMSIPVSANRTFDLFHEGTYPNPPDVTGADGFLTPDFRGGQEGGDRAGPIWTHIMLVDADLDVHDGYHGLGAYTPAMADTIYIP